MKTILIKDKLIYPLINEKSIVHFLITINFCCEIKPISSIHKIKLICS